MHIQRRLRTTCGLAISFAMFTSLGLAASAQQASGAQQTSADQQAPMQQRNPPDQNTTGNQKATVAGMVTGRNGSSMFVKTSDSPRLTVLLSDNPKTTEKGGFLGLSRRNPGIESLVPGLYVKVEGAYNSDHQLVAKKILFSRSSLTVANQIDAGVAPVNEKVAAAQDQLKSDRKDIEQTQQDNAKNSQDINTTNQGLAATNQVTATNTQGIGKANQRFTTLDQYETKGSVTINFANGKSTVSKDDKQKLIDFVQQAANTPGYMIEVQGYASTVGSAALNQRLSAERADAVLAIIQQTGAVPMTRILAPAAMGTTNQIGDDHTRSGQAQNRRVVVTIVVNKGITG